MQVGQEEGLLSHTKIFSLEYKLESKTSTSSALPLYTSFLPTSPPTSPSLINSSLSYHIMSQHDLNKIIRQQDKQITAMQIQIQALLTGAIAERGVRDRTEVVRLQIFDGTSLKILGFVTAYRLYIRIKMREAVVEEQIQ